jgi:hypothetical protein
MPIPPDLARLVLAAAALAFGLAAGAAERGHSAHAAAPRTPTAPANPCDTFYDAPFTPVAVSTQAYTEPLPASPKPDKAVPVTDPVFKTCMVRATQHDADPPKVFARNDYSRRQAINADGTRYLVYTMDGSWHLYATHTLAYVSKLDGLGGDAEPQWHPTDPNALYYVPTNGGTKLLRIDTRTNRSTVAVDFRGKLPAWAANAAHIWTRSEGSPSADARYWGFQVEDDRFNLLGYIVWDLVGQRLLGSRQNTDRPDHVSMTPSGRWFIASGERAGTDGDGEWAFSPDFTVKKRVSATAEHSDLAIGANGHDLYVSIDYGSSHGDVFYVDIDACPSVPADARHANPCPRTLLFQIYDNGSTAASHFSAKAFGKPGWVLYSTYDTVPTRAHQWPWYTDAVFAVELAPSPRIFGLGHHHSKAPGCYWAEPQASVSRDFTRIMFNSDWGDGTGCPRDNPAAAHDVDDYMIVLPSDLLPAAR